MVWGLLTEVKVMVISPPLKEVGSALSRRREQMGSAKMQGSPGGWNEEGRKWIG